MSALPAPTAHDDVQELIRQHGGDAEAALLACFREIDRLGIFLERATSATAFGYTWER